MCCGDGRFRAGLRMLFFVDLASARPIAPPAAAAVAATAELSLSITLGLGRIRKDRRDTDRCDRPGTAPPRIKDARLAVWCFSYLVLWCLKPHLALLFFCRYFEKICYPVPGAGDIRVQVKHFAVPFWTASFLFLTAGRASGRREAKGFGGGGCDHGADALTEPPREGA